MCDGIAVKFHFKAFSGSMVAGKLSGRVTLTLFETLRASEVTWDKEAF